MRRLSSQEEPEPLHSKQPGVHCDTGSANEVRCHGCVCHAGGHSGETYDCVILAVDRHSGYIVAVPGKKSKKKDKKDKLGVGLQAKTVANAMIRHWLTPFDVPAIICSDRGSQFVGAWFRTMCKHMGIRHAKTVAYHSQSNGRAEVAGRQTFGKFRQLHIDELGRNWYNSLWRVIQAYHDLSGPAGLSPHRILFRRDRVSRALLWLNHGKVARDANAMIAEPDDTAARVCKTLQDKHEKRAKASSRGKSRGMLSRTPYGWSRTTTTSCPGIGRCLGMCRG